MTEQVTSTTQQWKAVTAAVVLTAPSGNKCLARRPDSLQVFMEQGIVPNSLLPIVEKALSGKTLDPKALAEEAMADPAKIADMIALTDAIVVNCVIEPQVAPVPLYTAKHSEEGKCLKKQIGTKIPFGSEHRDIDVLYVDEIVSEDKMYIFQFAVGGTRDLEKFRSESAATLESVAAGAGVEGTA